MAASLLGTGRSRLLQTALLPHLSKEDWSVFQSFLRRIVQTYEEQTCKVRVKKKKGDALWVRLKGWVLQGPHGELKEIRLVLNDITDSNRLEELESIREGSQDILR